MSSNKLENTKEEEEEKESWDGVVTVVVIICVAFIVITLIVFGLNAARIINLFGEQPSRSSSWTHDSTHTTERLIPAETMLTNKDISYKYITSGRNLPARSGRVITYPTERQKMDRMNLERLEKGFSMV